MAKYCIVCGTQLRDDAKFCTNCGNKTDFTQDAPKPIRTKPKKIVMIPVLIFAVIAFSFVFYAFLDLNGLSPFGGSSGVSGNWEGTCHLTNNCANPACEYYGSVYLQLTQNGDTVTGTITIDIPESGVTTLISGQGCQALYGTGQITNGAISSSRLTFFDPIGNLWSLNVISSGLQGIVTSDAVGCTGLAGTATLSR